MSDAITTVLRSDKTMVQEGETVRNTVTITNNSAAKLNNTFISNPTPNGGSYVAGSVKVNGVAQPTYTMTSGFFLPDLNPGESITVEYDMKVDSPAVLTRINDVSEFQYSVNDPARGSVTYSVDSNAIALDVLSAKLSVVKAVDKAFAVKGETLHYTITVTNTGNVTKTDLIFKDPIPAGTSFVANSVKINGTGYSVYHPAIGFALRSLAPEETLTVEFDVQVN